MSQAGDADAAQTPCVSVMLLSMGPGVGEPVHSPTHLQANRGHGVPMVRAKVWGMVPKCPTSAHHSQLMIHGCNHGNHSRVHMEWPARSPTLEYVESPSGLATPEPTSVQSPHGKASVAIEVGEGQQHLSLLD